MLEYPDGRILYESVWVCQYIDEVFPENCLTPTDPFKKARDMIMVDFCEKVSWDRNERLSFHFHLGFVSGFVGCLSLLLMTSYVV